MLTIIIIMLKRIDCFRYLYCELKFLSKNLKLCNKFKIKSSYFTLHNYDYIINIRI